jgi:GT2 family glycosyltransferase
MNMGNKLSVVIASVNGSPIIRECLESLRQQPKSEELEVIVAHRCTDRVSEAIRRDFPWVTLIDAPGATTIPELRALAVRDSSGEVVAVLEDHCLVTKDWARQMIEAHQGEYDVIGGSLENAACERFVDWAAFFCEYYQAMEPIPAGEAKTIPGNNVSYKRRVLERFLKNMEAGEWDFVLHERMKASGTPLYSAPSITVHHKLSMDLRRALFQKFHFARSFAGMRFANPSRVRRGLYGVGAVFLPIVMARRIFACVWKKGSHRRELLLSSPILMLLLLSWGLGETIGYIFGPGSSSVKVA